MIVEIINAYNAILTTDPYLVPRLRMYRTIHSLPNTSSWRRTLLSIGATLHLPYSTY